jgi:hypothetical protein
MMSQVRSLAQLAKLKELLDQGAITQEEFQAKTQGVDPKKLPDRISTTQKTENKRHHKPSHHPKRAW